MPYLQAWSLGVQHEIAGNVVDITYVGNKDSHLWARTWPNQPPPGPGDIDSRRPYTNVSTVAGNEPIGSASYNGLQIRAQRRYSHGLAFLALYTFSKALTDTQLAETGAFVPDLQDAHDSACEPRALVCRRPAALHAERALRTSVREGMPRDTSSASSTDYSRLAAGRHLDGAERPAADGDAAIRQPECRGRREAAGPGRRP